MNESEEPIIESKEPESILSAWEPAGLLLSIFFVALPPVVAILLKPFSLYLLVLWSIWAIYLALTTTPINRLAGTRLLMGCLVGFGYLAFFDK